MKVSMTPRQAVAALRGLEQAAIGGEVRAWRARGRVMVGLFDAGWTWDDDTETWRHSPDPAIQDPS